MKKWTAFAIAGVCLLGASQVTAQSTPHQLVPLWETDTILKVPESVLVDARHDILYISNIGGKPAAEKKGSIGKLSRDGKVIRVEWVKGLQGPKGMGLYKNLLYVADINEVVVIDVNKAAIVQHIPVEGATFLNDITIDAAGVVYVSDSDQKKVHRIENGHVTVWVDGLERPNGLLALGKELYILDNGSLYKTAVDRSLVKLADGMEGGTDGLVQVKANEFVVSCWAGSIWYVKANGEKQHLLDTRDIKMNTADIAWDAERGVLYVPTFWKNKVVAYALQ